MIDRRRLIATSLIAPALTGSALAGSAWAADGTPAATTSAIQPATLEDLFRKPVLLDAALSPDGERVAVLREERGLAPPGSTPAAKQLKPQGTFRPAPGSKLAPPGPPKARLAYVRLSRVADLDGKPVQVLLGDHDVRQVEWANNERLLVWITIEGSADITQADEGPAKLRSRNDSRAKRVMSIGADGKDSVLLAADPRYGFDKNWNMDNVVDLLPNDPDHVIMQIGRNNRWNLYRVNVYTGEPVLMEQGFPNTDAWFLQDGIPVLRLDSNGNDTVVTVFARAPGASDWTLYHRFRRNEVDKLADFDVVGATNEPGILLVASQQPGDDTVKVRRFDVASLTLGDTVAQHPGRDIEEVFQDEAGGIVGARYIEDRDAYDFVDSGLALHFRALNKFYEDQCNIRLFDVSRDHSRFIVKVSGPQQPGAFSLYDRNALHVEDLGETRPWLSGHLAGMEVLRMQARDGLSLTAYLTVPINPPKAPAPMVVMPHGGPQARDSYSYDRWVQVLAARGWLVLQPNFRGSGGLGRAFAEAGHHRWGEAMQWDVQDCVEVLVKSGRADPGRLAIMGGSYGGYAAMMGAILQPDRYRCVISRAGPSDLTDFLTYVRGVDGPKSPLYSWWTSLIGDPAQDAAMLAAASPASRAGELKAPLLLFHGAWDPIVPVAASRDMEKAMKKAGRFCAYYEVGAEGHSGWAFDDEAIFLKKSADFIAQSFGV